MYSIYDTVKLNLTSSALYLLLGSAFRVAKQEFMCFCVTAAQVTNMYCYSNEQSYLNVYLGLQ